jgi:pyruvate,orthophosphate dikinase
MQAEAIMAAAKAVAERTGTAPQLEIMVPLIDYERELELMRELIVGVGDRHGMSEGVDYTVGTMIELPRACLVAERIARYADFFSFGTNDLTQTTLGFSRDDVEGKFLPTYLEARIVDRSPFETIDVPGVGELVQIAGERGRRTKPALKLGVCGEHGGDPDSIAFFDAVGIDYVSCSPFRVPVARVAAAQAAVRDDTSNPEPVSELIGIARP